MRGMLALLSPHEETAPRKIRAGKPDQLEESHLRRLPGLDLIEWDGLAWRPTPLGQQRYAVLLADTSESHDPHQRDPASSIRRSPANSRRSLRCDDSDTVSPFASLRSMSTSKSLRFRTMKDKRSGLDRVPGVSG